MSGLVSKKATLANWEIVRFIRLPVDILNLVVFDVSEE
jgi:hypothetical protein